MRIYITVDTETGKVSYLKVPLAFQCENCREENPDLKHDKDCNCEECKTIRGENGKDLKLPF